jgi:acyl dehydratase
MAFAAGLGRDDPCHLDTRRERGVLAHPLFPVCLEWPAVLAMGDRLAAAGLARDEAGRGVHHTHDLVVHRSARAGDRLRTTATIVSVDDRPSGVLAVLRLDTVDDSGAPVATTAMGTLYRAAAPPTSSPTSLPAGPRPRSEAQASDDGGGAPRLTRRLPIASTAAHVYSECARIWNPIHTDPRTAARAGLPGIILHGTATLALAVSSVVDHDGGGDPERVRRIGARFVGMVRVPSEIEIRILDRTAGAGVPSGDLVRFDVRDSGGRTVVADGTVVLAP